MIKLMKAVDSLTAADLKGTPIWQYASRQGASEIMVRPVTKIPARNLRGKVVGTRVTLANGTQVWALIGNIDPLDPRQTEHFLTLSIERNGRWFALARYHDFDYTDRGPDALCRFLGLAVDEISPISFDVRQYAEGDPAALKGSVPRH